MFTCHICNTHNESASEHNWFNIWSKCCYVCANYLLHFCVWVFSFFDKLRYRNEIFFFMYNVNIVWRLKPLEGCLYHISIVMLKNKSIYNNFHESWNIFMNFIRILAAFLNSCVSYFCWNLTRHTWLLIIYYEYHLTFLMTYWCHLWHIFFMSAISGLKKKNLKVFCLCYENNFFIKKKLIKEKINSCFKIFFEIFFFVIFFVTLLTNFYCFCFNMIFH